MKIIGIGVDIVKNSRISSSIKNKGFVNRIFSKKEISYSSFSPRGILKSDRAGGALTEQPPTILSA